MVRLFFCFAARPIFCPFSDPTPPRPHTHPPLRAGGHDSKFHSNVVIAVHGQNCVGAASFVPGHATQIYDNDCVVYGNEKVDDLFENCNSDVLKSGGNLHGYNNRFYTELGNASAKCDCCGLRPLAMLEKGLEDNSTASLLPTGDQIIAWGRSKLFGGL